MADILLMSMTGCFAVAKCTSEIFSVTGLPAPITKIVQSACSAFISCISSIPVSRSIVVRTFYGEMKFWGVKTWGYSASFQLICRLSIGENALLLKPLRRYHVDSSILSIIRGYSTFGLIRAYFEEHAAYDRGFPRPIRS